MLKGIIVLNHTFEPTTFRLLAYIFKYYRDVIELTCAEYLARRRPASQPLSHTRSCLACSSSLFSRMRDSLASLIFLSLSARRRSISLRRFLLASVASRSFSFLATRRNSSSCGRHGNKLMIIHSFNEHVMIYTVSIRNNRAYL